MKIIQQRGWKGLEVTCNECATVLLVEADDIRLAEARDIKLAETSRRPCYFYVRCQYCNSGIQLFDVEKTIPVSIWGPVYEEKTGLPYMLDDGVVISLDKFLMVW